MNRQISQVEFSRSRRELILALRKLRRGDFSVRLPEDGDETDVEIATLFNEVDTIRIAHIKLLNIARFFSSQLSSFGVSRTLGI